MAKLWVNKFEENDKAVLWDFLAFPAQTQYIDANEYHDNRLNDLGRI